jgi:hypothetical protein
VSVAGADRLATWLWRLPHLAGVERDQTLAALRDHAGELVALDHLPEVAARHAEFLADGTASGPLRAALLAERARHDATALRDCQRALMRWALAPERTSGEALAERWPRLARELADYRALERWLRDGSAEGLRPASELTMRWEDAADATPPRRFEARIDPATDVEALAAAWARALDGGFALGEAPRVVAWRGPPGLALDRAAVRLGARYGMVTSRSEWFDGPGDVLACWGVFARPLGLGPDAWMLVRMEGNDAAPDAALVVECSAGPAALAALGRRCQTSGIPSES